ncbi:Para-nitrobenzyl esterase [Cytospora mali]|uniref:Carboxylic ester hydrolase n=1 Tax=Cytospora mali TaxID=578113 RepID=A0A194W6F2_CYTMA|nr:Para-nitrobenzyl esterase [Valsa mali]
MIWRTAPATTGRGLLSLMSLPSLLRPTEATEAVIAPATLPSIHAETLNGTIQGGRCSRTDVDYFFSIPYAEPPLGELRFSPPSSHFEAYNGTLDGTVATPACPQFGSSFVESGPQDENCLFVNVWRPVGVDSSSGLPVKVWIFGGSNEAGGISNPTYDGCYSATDSVVVSINYRVGPLGFLAIPGLGLNGNYGIMDQLLALLWIQENVAAFGGDPNKVLLFGQSAGAANAFAIATMANAPKLMKAAALESGGGRDYPTITQAEPWHRTFAEQLNCSTLDITCLRSASISSLQTAHLDMPSVSVPGASSLLEHNGAGPGWGALIDGHLIPENPRTAGVRVPSIFGSTTREGSLFLLSKYGLEFASLGQSTYNDFLEFNFGPLASFVNQTYSLSKFARTGLPGYTAMLHVLTEYAYRCPAYMGLKGAAKNGVPAWTYSFGHTPSCSWFDTIPKSPALLRMLGPTHTSEIPFLFNLTTRLAPPDGDCSFTAGEKELAATMSRAWTHMASTGTPGDDSLWPQWDATSNPGVNMNDGLEVGTVDYSMCSAFWDGVMDEVARISQPRTMLVMQSGKAPEADVPAALSQLENMESHRAKDQDDHAHTFESEL